MAKQTKQPASKSDAKRRAAGAEKATNKATASKPAAKKGGKGGR